MGSPLVAEGFQFHNEIMLYCLGFPPHSNEAKGWRRLSRWTRVLRAHFNRHHSAAGFEMGGSEGASSLPGS